LKKKSLIIGHLTINYFKLTALGSQPGYKVRDLSLGTTLGTLTTPVYMKAAVQGLFGLPGSFVVTPKGRINVLPLRDLWPQVTLAIVAFITMVWGSLRLLHEGEPFFGLVFNMFWITYYFTIFASIFYFNQPEAQSGE
jgi:cellulose synthase (UDP-forming)